eukprot:jgi/Mesen1/7966/ME000422S07124
MVLNLLRGALGSIQRNGIVGALKRANEEGYLKMFLDGNLFQTKVRANGATLVGIDTFGNKYYERLHDVQYGRHRWVEFKDSHNYDASTVPPEWHGWLHHINDYTPEQLIKFRPAYLQEHKRNPTGEGDEKIYHAKGHALNPNQREWKKFEPWTPSSTP